MLGRMMNNYLYGKNGKKDFNQSDLPRTRWQLFKEMLRTRLSGLAHLNGIYMLCWLPTMAVIVLCIISLFYGPALGEGNVDMLNQLMSTTLMLLVPCIAITGPFTAGACYVTRNWARDEHAFVWADFKQAMKENWKQSLAVSTITGIIPLLVYVCWNFYGQMSAQMPVMAVLQVLMAALGVIWMLMLPYIYPTIVTYELRLRDVIRNAFILMMARLPMTIGLRLLLSVPVILGLIGAMFDPTIAMLSVSVYYLLCGFSLSRFVTASYTNAVFDKYINSRIEGAQVDRGLNPHKDEDDEDEYEDDEDEQA